MNELTELLKTEFEIRKKKNPQFSLRAFSRWLDLSPAQVSQIISGKRTITAKSFAKISDKLRLSPFEQKKYFYATKSKLYVNDQNKNKLAEDQFRLIADWYHMAILSLTRISGAKSDSRWIAKQLGITVQQANDATNRLVRLGCLQLKPVFRQIGEPFEVTTEVPSAAIRKYHQQCLQLAIEKIEHVPFEKRQIQSLNLPISLKLLSKFKILIDTFFDDALTLTEKSLKQQEEVFQLNVQLIPVTQIHK